MEKSKLFDKAASTPEERVFCARVLDKLEQARTRNSVTATGFLSPQEQARAEALLHTAGVRSGYCFDGGFAEAERKRLRFAPDWMDEELLRTEEDISCLYCRFYEGDVLSHRDFLGSLLALGLTREKLGDILVGAGEAQILTDTAVLPFLLREYGSAGRTKLRVSERMLSELKPPEIKTRAIHDTVMSLRLDSVCAVGFSVSRARAAEWIHAGKVEVNHLPCDKNDRQLAEGDTVSARGCGKFRLETVGGESKKGRIIITVKRFI